jgi:hypothetical protein
MSWRTIVLAPWPGTGARPDNGSHNFFDLICHIFAMQDDAQSMDILFLRGTSIR